MRALLVVLVCFAAPAAACGRDGGAGTITGHDERLSIRLDDGREVRLAALVPATDADPGAPGIDLSPLIGWRASVRMVGEPDRWGRVVGDLVIDGADRPLSGRLLSEGLALVDPAAMPSQCLDALFDAEAGGEARRAGIWAGVSSATRTIRPLPRRSGASHSWRASSTAWARRGARSI